MKIVHFCAGLEPNNGMANTARQFVAEETAAGHVSSLTSIPRDVFKGVDRVIAHGAWLPVLWKVAKRAKQGGSELYIRPAGSYDPVRLAYHGGRKRLVGFWERRMLRRADVVLATCEEEADWIRAYEPKVKKVEITNLKRFFRLDQERTEDQGERRSGHLLYLGRRHPLKGVAYLERAVAEILAESKGADGRRTVELRVVSDHFGEELERDWTWCDVLCLPTLSENFGRVVAEALERGKRVIVTDGAPVWRPERNRLVYVEGFRDGTDEERVALVRRAVERTFGIISGQ